MYIMVEGGHRLEDQGVTQNEAQIGLTISSHRFHEPSRQS